MTKTTHVRKKHVITELATYKYVKNEEGVEIETLDVPAGYTDHGTINKAKKASVLLQQSDGGLGCGAVRVAKVDVEAA